MATEAVSRWRGWPSAPAGREWTDLTHPISPAVPRLEKFAPPRLRKLSSLPEDSSSVTQVEIVCHTGTHVDAPNHFVAGAPGVDEIPLARLCGTATVVHTELRDRTEVRGEDLECHAIGPHEIVILDTGWWRTPGDGDHPHLGEEAAWWLVNLGRLPEKVEALVLPLPIAGADGAPARVLVRPQPQG